MKFGVIVFPGSNCDHDSYHAAITATGQQAAMLWHDSHDLENCDAIIVPGGFAYGDYLRTGAIANFSPVMQSVKVCRLRRAGARHLQRLSDPLRSRPAARRADAQCRPEVHLQAGPPARGNHEYPVHQQLQAKGEVLQIPIGHMEGNYFCDDATLAALERPGPHRLPLPRPMANHA